MQGNIESGYDELNVRLTFGNLVLIRRNSATTPERAFGDIVVEKSDPIAISLSESKIAGD